MLLFTLRGEWSRPIGERPARASLVRQEHGMTTSNEGPYRTQPPVPPTPPPTRVYAVLATLAMIWGLIGAIAMISTSHHPAYDGRSDEWVKYAIAVFPSGLAGLFILRRLLSFAPKVRPAGLVMAAIAMCLPAFAWTGTLFLHTPAPYQSAHGRRHRKSKGGKNLLAEHEESEAWTAASFELDVPEETRFALAAEWRENARKEHASIAAFSQLALDLMAVGAPPHLLAAAHRDAADEVRHAELCYGVARSIDGVALSPAPFPEARAQKAAAKTRSEALTQVAIDSLMDGVLSEGTAARACQKRVGSRNLLTRFVQSQQMSHATRRIAGT